jgi:RNA polymerase sigma factor (sigma-70 family)
MASTRLSDALRSLYQVIGLVNQSSLTDKQLLERFATARDKDAFATLVQRHGPLVLGASRRVLSHTQDREDVFQATFLALANWAARGRWQESVAGWLHRVAHRLAIKTRADAERRRAHERQGRVLHESEEFRPEFSTRDVAVVLDEELQALSDSYREPLVLCYLEGKTADQAARLLNCSPRTLHRRLERGRQLLRVRLTGRGIDLSTGLMAVGLTLAPSVPAALAHSTVKAALMSTGGPVAAGLISARAAALANAAVKTYCLGKTIPTVLGMVVVGTFLAGAGVWNSQHRKVEGIPAENSPKAKLWSATTLKEKPKRPEPARLDLFGAPLPEHAVARMGMARFRHGGAVGSVVYAPDAKTIASASWNDKTVRLCDAATGQELRKLQGHDAPVLAVAFAPDGKTLASASLDKTVRLWEAATGKELRKLKGHQQFVRAIAFSPDGNELVSASWDKTARIWEVASGLELLRFGGHTQQIRSVAFSVNGEMVASGGVDRSIRLWNARTGEEIEKLEGHTDAVVVVTFSPDGKRLASSGVDKTIRLWDVATGRELRKLQGHKGSVSALVFAPDGQTLVSGSHDQTIRFWDVSTGTHLRTLKAHLDRFAHFGDVLALAFSRDGESLVSGGEDQAIRLWEPSTGEEIQNWQGHKERVSSVAFSLDGKTLASSSLDNTIRLWEAATGKQLRQLDGPPHSAFYAMAVSPDGKTLATGSYGHTVATGNHINTVHLWESATGKKIRKLEGHTDTVLTVAFSPDGQKLASGDDKTVRLWDVATGKELHVWENQTLVHSVAFSPDGKTLTTAGKTINFWDLVLGKQIGKLEGHEELVVSVAFSPDSKMLASASWDGTVRVWDVAGSKEVLRLKGHEYMVHAVAFAPRGRYLASGGWDGTVRLWELASGRECQRFTGHESSVCSVAFSPDGQRLASGANDDTVLVWDLTGQRGKPPPARRLDREDLDQLWSDLANDDAAQAYRAGCLLAGMPTQTVHLLRQHLRELLESENSPPFDLGHACANSLSLAGGKADKDAGVCLPGFVPGGKRQGLVSFGKLRMARSVAVLEQVGSDQAKALLCEITERAREGRAVLNREFGWPP